MKQDTIYAVDFDGTLSFGEWPNTGAPNHKLFAFLKQEQKKGAKLILWTCRVGSLLEDAVSYCAEHDLCFDAVNENLPSMIERYGGDTRKVFAHYYIDDRMLHIENKKLTPN